MRDLTLDLTLDDSAEAAGDNELLDASFLSLTKDVQGPVDSSLDNCEVSEVHIDKPGRNTLIVSSALAFPGSGAAT